MHKLTQIWLNYMLRLREQRWNEVLEGEFEKDYFQEIERKVDEARSSTVVYPAPDKVFRAFDECPFDSVKVVILGQDPYHDEGTACGLSFATGNPSGKVPPSAKNILKEYATDLDLPAVPSVEIMQQWPSKGVLMLNTILTVEKDKALSHAKFGWERFTDAVIKAISDHKTGVVFLLWGKYAASKASLIDPERHHILIAAHPSPLARGAFFGSKPFSKANALLGEQIFTAPDNGPLTLF